MKKNGGAQDHMSAEACRVSMKPMGEGHYREKKNLIKIILGYARILKERCRNGWKVCELRKSRQAGEGCWKGRKASRERKK